MAAVRALADAGGPVLGVCNGFQVLTEAGLLPGALRPNDHLQFRFEDAGLRVQRQSAWLPGLVAGDVIEIPVKHHDGCFFAAPDQLAELDANGQVLLRYVRNPNGSVESIACVTNAAGNVAGLMPHPEHAVDPVLGSVDGRILLQGLIDQAVAVEATI
jgi:phosphoribosylformylglycinamidine synthase